ncbi:nucleoside-diphosphate kinase [Celerinatantimonas diazotrophica]|uniref:Nucleoside diphosphate kinase n=1 Tax=Celerinatantimonas diazotrophica TaxID=412034 RepID=A0A4V2PPT5_9GAMM|nr:nucleoside-diphosphate kinase [Celerinatantimonas diazotrophica]TCK52201.1 nucleoside diphosphate kinase [Celerinatantimonas diazotrophica]CAG9296093.1 Nucleoside diphosphate kinase [Celerinatantimonas diazotrophica]
MVRERTFSIIKPDAVKQAHIGAIYHQIESAGLRIVAAKMLHLSKAQAEGFYGEHEGKPFYDALIEFMTQGPIMVQVLEGENAIEVYRNLMGATDPSQAEAGTLRANYGSGMPANATHGSDSAEAVSREIAFFFSDDEIIG